MKKKIPKSIVVSYRVSPVIIAKAIDGLKQYDKTADIETLSQICKRAMLHGVNYLTQSLPFEPNPSSMIKVYNLTSQGRRKDTSALEFQIMGSKLNLPQAINEDREEKETSSPIVEKKVITDWSITPDMRESEETD